MRTPIAVWLLAASLLLGCALLVAQPAQASQRQVVRITLDGRHGGAVTGGVGAISGGGGNSRLLIDYPEPERSQILDYLFRPGYGASLQVLKLEIGGDSNTSAGAEPSVEHEPGVLDCGGGYEWWLAEQAVRRNPRIKLYGLQWGAPGWVAGATDAAAASSTTSATTSTSDVAGAPHGIWSQDDIDYVLHWLGCARQHGLSISYLGGWNEKFDPAQDPAGVAWFEKMRDALDRNGFGNVGLVAADRLGPDRWAVADVMARDPAFDSAVDVIGVHDNCGYPPGPDGDKEPFGFHCSGSGTARRLHKPMWGSEDGKLDADRGAATMVRELLNGYNQAGITGVIEYPLVTAMVDNLPLQNRGLVTAKSPWSGAYRVNEMTWALAHVTQFVPQGWRHVNGANRSLGGTGSYNSFESPDHRQWSLVAQNTGAYRGQHVVAQTLRVRLQGGLRSSTVHVWATNLWSRDPSQWFVHRADVHPRRGVFRYRVPPGYVISFTSRSAAVRKGTVAAGPATTAPLTGYTATPDAAGMPRYLSPVDGAFLYQPCRAGRTGSCIEQRAVQPPVYWVGPTAPPRVPYAVVGEGDWGDYTVAVDVLLTGQGSRAGLVSRFAGGCGLFSRGCSLGDSQRFDGYEFLLADDGSWELYRNSVAGGRAVLESGSLAGPLSGLFAGGWHHLSLQAAGSTLVAAVDGRPVAQVADTSWSNGLAGIESDWSAVQFDGLTVR